MPAGKGGEVRDQRVNIRARLGSQLCTPRESHKSKARGALKWNHSTTMPVSRLLTTSTTTLPSPTITATATAAHRLAPCPASVAHCRRYALKLNMFNMCWQSSPVPDTAPSCSLPPPTPAGMYCVQCTLHEIKTYALRCRHRPLTEQVTPNDSHPPDRAHANGICTQNSWWLPATYNFIFINCFPSNGNARRAGTCTLTHTHIYTRTVNE